MERDTRALRTAVWATLILGIVGLPVEHFASPGLSMTEIDLKEAYGVYYLSPTLLFGIGVALFALWLAGTIGLLRLWKLGRALYVTSMLATLGLNLLMGPTVLAPEIAILRSVEWALVGVVLGLTFLSEARVHFEGAPVAVGVVATP